jgi:pyridoxal phosphate enzyme (YggS family)
MTVETRLADVQMRMQSASRRARRDPAATALIAVSKTFGAKDIQPLIAAGQRRFGENRVQEAQAKWPALKAAHPDIELHLIGQLQSNKAADAVSLFDVIHSVDRPSLVSALAGAMVSQNRHLPCLLQVNIGDEPQKGGCTIADLPALLADARSAGLDIIGLMAIPPAALDPAPFFALLHKLARRHGLTHCSMGMSSDFETAIALGSTMVRVGSALFGDRA